ncbi:MAG: hypothetical protein ACOYNL_04165 [Rickettsiales bacterium]
MDTPVPAPQPTPSPQPSVVAQAAHSIASVKTKHDYLRPLRYVKNFIGGTLTDGLDDMSVLGRLGFKSGIVAGVIYGIMVAATGWGIAAVMVGAAAGLAAGAAAGGAYGFVTGGYRAVMRQHRGEVYAEDLVKRKTIQESAPPNRADYRSVHNRYQRYQDEKARQFRERANENAMDYKTYWQDRVTHEPPGGPGVGY